MKHYNHEKLLKLAGELLPSDPSLVEELREVIENTPEYSVRYEQYLDDTGFVAIEIEEHLHEILWNTLLNGLRERNRLADVELEDLPSGVAMNIDDLLENLPPNANRWSWIESEDWHKQMPNVFLKEVQKRVIDPNRILTCLDIDLDGYALCLINASKFEKIEKLSLESSYGKVVKVADL